MIAYSQKFDFDTETFVHTYLTVSYIPIKIIDYGEENNRVDYRTVRTYL